MLGAVAHLAIQGITVARRTEKRLARPWNDWVTWLHAHETRVLGGIGGLIVMFTLLAFTMKDLTWQAAFFAGYTSDSLLDVLLDRFDTVVGKQSSKLTELARGS